MRSWTLAFLCGVLLLQPFQILPASYWVVILISIYSVWFLWGGKSIFLFRLPMAMVLGFTWCLWFAHFQSAWQLDENWEGKPLSASGYIASIPDKNIRGTSFLFALKELQYENKKIKCHSKIRLTWRNEKETLHVGDGWRFVVHLKKTYGTLNPGGFDYEAFALQEGIRANGYVVTKFPSMHLSSHWYRYSIDRVREFLKEKMAVNLAASNTSQWITALTIGERHDINQADWQVLRNTGTNHLMAIAGLHIGFMAAFAHFIVAFVWRRIPRLTLILPAVHAGAIAALIMALTYSAMAGFSIPTQRACLMLSVFLITLLQRRNIASWHAWSTALLCVLLWNPLSVLTESFWLSFGSVALIIYGVGGRLAPGGLWWKWGRIQWVIAIGLLPLSIWLFQQFSFISFVANSIAIPWVGFIVVPLCFIGCFTLFFSAKAGGVILGLADKILNVLWSILAWLSHVPGMVWYQMVPSHWILLAALVGILFLLSPIGFPGRYLGLIWLLPLILFKPHAPKMGEAWLSVLDVGQGLAVVLQTEKHVLVYDAGPRLSTTYDMGESVVVPFLHAIGAKQIDMMVISHGDNDHIGGANAVIGQFPVLSIKTSVPEKLPNANYCLRGMSWRWDGVDFSFIYPTAENLNLDNDSSCVLRVTIGKRHILLTGDIEKWAEKELVANQRSELSADILVAPHHGSKTSGLESFIEAVHPNYVLFAVGYRNRYHFPHQLVVEKYRHLNVSAYETARTGAIQFHINADDTIALPDLYRAQHLHYWNNAI
ncbi:MAG: DNA internalization-related competence protein ComEC/Rec2 [Gammaproteobacteria bacterium]|nr:DNA internalization-related competence protein ComEC/Rec2 [Gammaproteobacteria bacterium]